MRLIHRRRPVAGGVADPPTDAPAEPSSEPPPPRSVEGRRSPIVPIAVAIVTMLAGGTLFMSGYSMGRQSAVEPGTPATASDAFRPFWDTFHTIVGRYAGAPVDQNTLVQGAIRGMIGSLGDPYSQYMTSDDYRTNLETIGGTFEGIGAELATENKDGSQGCNTLGPVCRLLIVAPIDGSPAQAAGLRAGDVVLGADGVPFDGLSIDSARDRIRGPSGSVVTLTIQRGTDRPFPVPVPRSLVQRAEVVGRSLADGTIGYLKLNGFSDHSASELRAAIAGDLAARQTRLILDLRGNPGGYVTAARAIASEFIGSGVIFYEQDASGAQVPTDAIPGGLATDPTIRVVCLIDGQSASASEIVAGALQDTGRALLVGQQSFGKGTVQQWQQLTGEGGAFRLTIARWLTPTKRWINKTGLQPDVPVAVEPGQPATADPTLQQAIDLLSGQAQRSVKRPPRTLALAGAIE